MDDYLFKPINDTKEIMKAHVEGVLLYYIWDGENVHDRSNYFAVTSTDDLVGMLFFDDCHIGVFENC